MDTALLREAQSGLQVVDVALRDARASLTKGFDPVYDKLPHQIQLMQRVLRSEVLEINSNGGQHQRVRVFIRLGIRWIRLINKTRKTDTTVDKAVPAAKSDVLAFIEATYMIEYDMTEEVSEAGLREFAQHSVPRQIWPFWREYVTNQCSRMNLPKVVLPMQCLNTDKTKATQ